MTTGVTEFPISNEVEMPVLAKPGAKSKYPFDDLAAPEVLKDKNGKARMNKDGSPMIRYSSFPIVDADKNEKSLQSTVYNVQKNYQTLLTDKDGNAVMEEYNAKGEKKTRQKFTQDRVFKAVDVDPKTDPNGANVRVFRIK